MAWRGNDENEDTSRGKDRPTRWRLIDHHQCGNATAPYRVHGDCEPRNARSGASLISVQPDEVRYARPSGNDRPRRMSGGSGGVPRSCRGSHNRGDDSSDGHQNQERHRQRIATATNALAPNRSANPSLLGPGGSEGARIGGGCAEPPSAQGGAPQYFPIDVLTIPH